MPTDASLPPPDFELASAYPEAGWLRQVAGARDWAAIRTYFAGLPYETDRAVLIRVVAELPGAEDFLRDVVAAAPDDVLALTMLGSREVAIGWEIRTAARADQVSREQFRQMHEHLRVGEQALIRATALDPTFHAAWAERLNTARGLQLGQNEARRRYDRLAAHHPHHFTGQARLLQQLCPKWGGTWEAAHGFARECLLSSPEGALNGGLVAEAHVEHWLDLPSSGNARAEYVRRPDVHAEVVEAAERSVLHPNHRPAYGWVTVQGEFAAFFSLAGDTARAAPHFRALGNLASEYPWGYLGNAREQFVRHRAAALGRAGRG
ncbi:hypothetical protein ACFXAW_25620 [Streptomyces sp. NPDC059445]|uniref:hypothetical protein n=1 Tax=Streptomyces sp. NPDC059445 TaxID=3346832 RepID=UPI0036AC993B